MKLSPELHPKTPPKNVLFLLRGVRGSLIQYCLGILTRSPPKMVMEGTAEGPSVALIKLTMTGISGTHVDPVSFAHRSHGNLRYPPKATLPQ